MKKMISRALVALVCLTALQGCQTMKALSFKKDDLSGIKESQSVSLYYIRPTAKEQAFKIVGDDPIHAGIRESLSQCVAEAVLPLVPIIAAGGTFLLGQLTDALASEVKKLRDSGTKSYSGMVLTDEVAYVAPWQECLLLLRHDKPPRQVNTASNAAEQVSDIGLAALFILNRYGGGYAWDLAFLMLNNAVAVTAKGDPPNLPKVDVSLALASKIVTQKDGVKTVTETPPATMTVKGVPLGGEEPAVRCKPVRDGEGGCEYSTAIFVVPEADQRPTGSDGTPQGGAWFSVGVTETGSVASDFANATAELEALKAALGPAVGKAIETALTPPAPSS